MPPTENGDLRPHGDRWQLTFTRRLPRPAAKVWRALTEAEHLTAWNPSKRWADVPARNVAANP